MSPAIQIVFFLVPTSPTNGLFFSRCQSHLQTDCFSLGTNVTYKTDYFCNDANLTPARIVFVLGDNLTSQTITMIKNEQSLRKSHLKLILQK